MGKIATFSIHHIVLDDGGFLQQIVSHGGVTGFQMIHLDTQ